MIHFLLIENVAGDPDTYAEAIVWSIAIICALLAYIAWLKWGDR